MDPKDLSTHPPSAPNKFTNHPPWLQKTLKKNTPAEGAAREGDFSPIPSANDRSARGLQIEIVFFSHIFTEKLYFLAKILPADRSLNARPLPQPPPPTLVDPIHLKEALGVCPKLPPTASN